MSNREQPGDMVDTSIAIRKKLPKVRCTCMSTIGIHYDLLLSYLGLFGSIWINSDPFHLT